MHMLRVAGNVVVWWWMSLIAETGCGEMPLMELNQRCGGCKQM